MSSKNQMDGDVVTHLIGGKVHHVICGKNFASMN